jgi:hypothetical protein
LSCDKLGLCIFLERREMRTETVIFILLVIEFMMGYWDGLEMQQRKRIKEKYSATTRER